MTTVEHPVSADRSLVTVVNNSRRSLLLTGSVAPPDRAIALIFKPV
ncbi:hypothetical protein [Baaleninema simplex]|nr:hypothetical protein [Baaleninema simplex]